MNNGEILTKGNYNNKCITIYVLRKFLGNNDVLITIHHIAPALISLHYKPIMRNYYMYYDDTVMVNNSTNINKTNNNLSS